ncbi:hypothetical protein [Lacrimispora sp.]|uniref:hypothetical protein n=1 Tax=Lacrimispora sp. TaxID=2719234 RepID=UPI002854F316|nr:hypothetical protein [Lacrimispora sp.]MDR7812385.1 hypothetical protein [Lacrimispora sp.]
MDMKYQADLTDARNEGRLEGRLKVERTIAIKMLRAGEPHEKIKQYTKYTDEELDVLYQSDCCES